MGANSAAWARTMRERLDLDLPEAEIERAIVDGVVDRYHAEGAPTIPGAVEAVRRIAADRPVAIASSAHRAVIDAALEATGLAPMFARRRLVRRGRARQAGTRRLPGGRPAPRRRTPRAAWWSRTPQRGPRGRARRHDRRCSCRTRASRPPPGPRSSPTSSSAAGGPGSAAIWQPGERADRRRACADPGEPRAGPATRPSTPSAGRSATGLAPSSWPASPGPGSAGPHRGSRAAAGRPGDLLLQPPVLGRPVRAHGDPAVPAAPVLLRAEGGGHGRRRPEPADALDRRDDPVQAGQERPARRDPARSRRPRRAAGSWPSRARGGSGRSRRAAAAQRRAGVLRAALPRPARADRDQRHELAALRRTGPGPGRRADRGQRAARSRRRSTRHDGAVSGRALAGPRRRSPPVARRRVASGAG